jgi:hypothetical protein
LGRHHESSGHGRHAFVAADVAPAIRFDRGRRRADVAADFVAFVAFVTKLGLAPVDEPEKLGEVISKEIAQWQQLVVELQLPRI